MTENKFDINDHTARLLMDEPFYAALSRRINKSANYGIQTAGVRADSKTGQLEMIYNPDFMASLGDAAVRDVLIHELLHIVYLHITERRPSNVEHYKLWNIATDLAINSHLNNLPDFVCKPGAKGTHFEDYPEGMSSDYYMKRLLEEMDQEKQGAGSGQASEQGTDGDSEPSKGISEQCQFDDHGGWDDISEETKKIAEQRAKDILKEAFDESAKNNSWGSLSSGLKKDIANTIKSTVDWRTVLRYFVKSSKKANKTSSIKRINRRYPYIHSGRKTNRVANIAVSIDQSYSVDDGMLAAFFAELDSLAKIASFTVIPFDTRVAEDKVYEWRRGERRKSERVLGGGTCFDAPTEFVNGGNFDGHIVLTDMCAPKPKPSKCQRMWMTTEQYAERPYFSTTERIVAITN